MGFDNFGIVNFTMEAKAVDFINYLECQLNKSKVTIKMGQTVTPELVQNLHPEVVILATGIVPLIPDIPGIQIDKVVTAQDILSYKVRTGLKVVIIGGELVGCETALFLALQGKRVTIRRRGPDFAAKVIPIIRETILRNPEPISIHPSDPPQPEVS